MSNILSFEYKYVYSPDFYVNQILLSKVYLPLMSPKALALYNFMNSELMMYNSTKFFTNNIASIFRYLNLNKKDEFEDARKNLEALKLLKTFFDKKTNTFYFQLLEPEKFEKLIENKKIEQTLINAIGENEYHKLKTQFLSSFLLNEYENISESFDDYFSNKEIGSNEFEFNFEKLYKSISQTSSLSIDISDVKEEINDYFVNNDVSYENIEKAIYNSIVRENDKFIVSKSLFINEMNLYNNVVNKLEFMDKLTINRNKEIFINKSSNDMLTKVFFDYKNLKPEQYLSAILKSPISKEEQEIIDELRKTYFINDSLINIMVDFSIDKTHHKLNAKYLAKVARSFNLENIKTVESAYEYLMSNNKDYKNKKSEMLNSEIVDKINKEDLNVEDKFFTSKKIEKEESIEKVFLNEDKFEYVDTFEFDL